MAKETENTDTEKVKMFRKRPNKAEILKQSKLRGHITHNEEVTLKGLMVKNSLQRIYNKTMDDSLNKTNCKKLTDAMDALNAIVEEICPKGKTKVS